MVKFTEDLLSKGCTGLYLMYCIFSRASFINVLPKMAEASVCTAASIFWLFLLSFLVLFHFTTFLLNTFRHLTPMLAFLLTGFGALVHVFLYSWEISKPWPYPQLELLEKQFPLYILDHWIFTFCTLFWQKNFFPSLYYPC